MLILVYDNSFEGLLTSIYDAYYSDIKPDEIVRDSLYEPNLLTEPKYIETNIDKYKKVYTAIQKKISFEALSNIFYAYLSDLKDIDTCIYNYIKLGFKLSKELTLYVHDDTVMKIDKIVRKVTWESTRMLGFIRFKCITNIIKNNIDSTVYYSSIEPDHNILILIADHFAKRLSNENWIIHDIKRETAVFYNKKDWIITPFTRNNEKKLNSKCDEEFYENLWRDYFKSTAIDERKNPKLQKNHMPLRYWKHLTEIN